MQIKKINNDKLKIILSSNDLDEKNVDVDSFLANPIESQNLFFEILDLAEEKYNFDIANNKAIVEAISLNNNIFILTITKFSTECPTYNQNIKVYCFEDINDLLNLCSFTKRNHIHTPEIEIYNFSNKYYLILNEENTSLENVLLEFSTLLSNSSYIQDIFKEYGKRI